MKSLLVLQTIRVQILIQHNVEDQECNAPDVTSVHVFKQVSDLTDFEEVNKTDEQSPADMYGINSVHVVYALVFANQQ